MNVQEIIDQVQTHLTTNNVGRELNPNDPLSHLNERLLDYTYNIRRIFGGPGEKIKHNQKDVLLNGTIIRKSNVEFPDWVGQEEAGVESSGMEALAWYRPWHFEHVGENGEGAVGDPGWGIYLLDRGIWTLAWFLHRNINPTPDSPSGEQYNTQDLIIIAAKILFFHEFFHFLTEVAGSTIEIASDFNRINYVDYHNQVYLPGLRNNTAGEPLEEALANAFSLKHSGNLRVSNALKQFMRGQPSGYHDFENFSSVEDFKVGRRRLGGYLVHTAEEPGGSPLEGFFSRNQMKINWFDAPVYIVSTIPEPEHQILGYARIQDNQWNEHPNFVREWRKYRKGKDQQRMQALYLDARQSVSSSDNTQRYNAHCKKILGNDSLWEFYIDYTTRGFYKICDDGRQFMVGVRSREGLNPHYPRLYQNIHPCDE